jgi:hypothetical protein
MTEVGAPVRAGYPSGNRTKEAGMLLILAIVLLIIAIAGGAIVHPLLFALAIVALVLFFTGRGSMA